MPSNYTVKLKYVSGKWNATAQRNSTTNTVDATSGAPNRLKVQDPMSAGPNAPVSRATVTGATNATPIVLTCTLDQGTFTDGDIVLVESVGGNTNANGTFEAGSISGGGTSITLVGSAGNANYTSGGKVRKLNNADTLHIALANVARAIINDFADGN